MHSILTSCFQTLSLQRLARTAIAIGLLMMVTLGMGSPLQGAAVDRMFAIAPAEASIFHLSGQRPTNLGVQDGKLAPCPSTPNCISSQAIDPEHSVAALTLPASRASLGKIKAAIETLPNAEIISETENYLYAEFTSDLMGFVDDVEFYVDEAAGVFQVRSASRLGESDLGVNRQRLAMIKTLLQ